MNKLYWGQIYPYTEWQTRLTVESRSVIREFNNGLRSVGPMRPFIRKDRDKRRRWRTKEMTSHANWIPWHISIDSKSILGASDIFVSNDNGRLMTWHKPDIPTQHPSSDNETPQSNAVIFNFKMWPLFPITWDMKRFALIKAISIGNKTGWRF